MKKSLIVAALALTTVTSFAMSKDTAPVHGMKASSHVVFVHQGDGLVPVYSNHSTTTRAEVLAELKASQARMDTVTMGGELMPRSTFIGQRSVAEVRAEASTSDRQHAQLSMKADH